MHISGGARIGRGCSFGQGVYVGNDVVIGDHVKIQNNVSVYDAVTLEDDVFCGPSMVFTNVYNPRSLIERKSEYRKTLVERGATLGANCTIVCGTTIGQFAFVGLAFAAGAAGAAEIRGEENVVVAADEVVVNHHLLFADVAVSESGVADLLPAVELVVFDETGEVVEVVPFGAQGGEMRQESVEKAEFGFLTFGRRRT